MLWKRRSHLDGIGERIGRVFSKLPLTPNNWTGLGLVLSFVAFYFLISRDFLAASIVFAFTAITDMIDGSVAKVRRRVTKIGGYLDSVTDRTVEFITIIGLFIVGYPDYIISMDLWLMLLLFGSFMSTYVRTVSFEKIFLGIKIKRETKGGVLEHADRMLVFLVIILVSNFSLLYASYIIVLTALISLVSALQRFIVITKR